MDLPHATIEEFAAGLYAHRVLLPSLSRDQTEADQLASRLSLGLTLPQLSARLRCVECGGPAALGQAVATQG
jgi:hypothetical protein